nr:hypothetical protein CFP56_25915 [Quercus suber]
MHCAKCSWQFSCCFVSIQCVNGKHQRTEQGDEVELDKAPGDDGPDGSPDATIRSPLPILWRSALAGMYKKESHKLTCSKHGKTVYRIENNSIIMDAKGQTTRH